MIVRADIESRLKGAGLQTMATGLRKIEAAQKRVQSGFRNVTGHFKTGFGIGSGIVVFQRMTQAIGETTRAVVASNMEFGRLAIQIKTLTVGGAEDIGRLNDQLVAMSSATGKGPTELARALFFVESSGIKGAAAMETTKATALAAAAGLGDSATVARTVVSAMNAYAGSHLTATQSVDKLIEMVRQGGAEASEYAGSLGRVLSVSAAAGVALDEVGGFMAVFTRQGVSADEAATALRSSILSITAPGEQAAKAFEAAGLSVDQLKRTLREQGLAETLDLITTAFNGDIDAMSRAIPNVRALSGILAVTGSNMKSYQEAVEAIANSTGNLADVGEETTKSLGFQWDRLGAVLLARTTSSEGAIGSFATNIVKDYADLAEGSSELRLSTLSLFGVFARMPAILRSVSDQARNYREAVSGIPTELPEFKQRGFARGAPVSAVPGAEEQMKILQGALTSDLTRLREEDKKAAEAAKKRAKEVEGLVAQWGGAAAGKQLQLLSEVFDELGAKGIPDMLAFNEEVYRLGQVAKTVPENLKTSAMLGDMDALAARTDAANAELVQTALAAGEVADGLEAALVPANEMPKPLEVAAEKTFDWQTALQGVALLVGATTGRLSEMLQVIGNIGEGFRGWSEMTREQKFGAIAGGVGQIGGLAGGRGGRALQGAAGGAMTGFSVGGPIGAIAGGLIGGIAGLFGGGKSDEEKAAERAAAEEKRRQFADLTSQIRDQYGSLAQAAEMAERYGVSLEGALDTRDAEKLGKALEEIEKRQAGLATARQGVLDFPWADPDLAEAAAGAFSSVFWATVKTQGITAATDALKPAWEQLQQTFAGYGLDTSALGGIGRLFEMASNPAFAAASQAASSMGQVIGGMRQAGMVDQSLLASGGATADVALQKAIEAGASPKEAFQLISPLLQQIVTASKATGEQLSPQMQELVNEAKANGIDILADPVYEQLDELRAIRKAVERTPGSVRPDVTAATGWGPRQLSRDIVFLAHKGEHVMIVPKGIPVGFRSAATGFANREPEPERPLTTPPSIPVMSPGGTLTPRMNAAEAGARKAAYAAEAAVAAVERMAAQPKVELTSAPTVVIEDTATVQTLESRRYLKEQVVGAVIEAVDQNARGLKVKFEKLARGATRLAS